MADRQFLSNDTNASTFGGVFPEEEVFNFGTANVLSVHGTAAVVQQLVAGPMPRNGRVIDVAIGVGHIALSASGFVSADVSCVLRNNSVAVCSTNPTIPGPVGSAGAAVYRATNAVATSAAGSPGAISAVVNTASANFSTGDVFTIDFTAASGGSAAAGATGVGFFGAMRVRYTAV